ncbi:MAG: RraA family protein [Acetobacteraceae bacterium]|nr:RraA family protein [Acetobacteraceae bacterium]MSP30045.1 RraA family protein [Acetobacteraceae bacterium]
MIDNPPLLSIHRGFARPDRALVVAFRGAQTSHLCDAMDGRGALDWRIKPLDPTNAGFVGVAMTAHAYPADIVAMFGALAEAQPGDVIVCANDAFTGTAVFGDLAAGMMRNKGVSAFVTDGLARDKAGIIVTGLPVFCQGISPNSPARNGPGVVGAPVTLGGVHVCPGDIIVGDADAVVVVPQGSATEVLARLRAVQAAELETEKKVRDGLVIPSFMVDILASARIVGR